MPPIPSPRPFPGAASRSFAAAGLILLAALSLLGTHLAGVSARAEGRAPASAAPSPTAPDGDVALLPATGSLTACFRSPGSSAPLPGVEVRLESLRPDAQDSLPASGALLGVRTDEAGMARYSDLPPGLYRIVVSDEDFLENEALDAEVASGETRTLGCAELKRAFPLAGRIATKDASLAPALEILLFRAGSGEGPVCRTQSDPTTGLFRFPRLDPAASYVLAIPGPRCVERAGRELHPGALPIVIPWSPGGGLEVTVVDAVTGRPVSPAEARAVPGDFPVERSPTAAEMTCLVKERTTDGSGRLRLEGLGSGEHRVAASAPGFSILSAKVSLPRGSDDPLVLRLSREECREVRTIDARTREPIEGAEIATEAEIFDSRQARELAPLLVTDALGRARFCPAYRGDRDFYVRGDGYAPRRVMLETSSPADALDVSLSSGGILTGTVRDGIGQPLAGLSVSVQALGCRFQTETDGSGRYRVERLPPGDATVMRDASQGTEPVRRSVRIDEGKITTADFGAETETTVLVLRDGDPVPGARAIVQAADGNGVEITSAETDGEGRLRLPGRLAHGATVCVRDGGTWVFMRVPGDRTGREERGRQVSFPSRRFDGRLVDGDGTPIAAASVVTMAAGGEVEEAPLTEDGPPVWISMEGSVSRTDAGGRFGSFVPTGSRGVLALLATGEGRFASLPEGASGDVILESSARVRVHLHGTNGVAGLGLAREGQHSFAGTVTAPADGVLEMEAPAGRYALVVWEDAMAPYLEPGVLAAPGDVIDRDIILTEGGRLRVVFEGDPGHDPLAQPGFLTSNGIDWSWLLRRIVPAQYLPPGSVPPQVVISHLPAGLFSVACPAKRREVRISEGKESVLECR